MYELAFYRDEYKSPDEAENDGAIYSLGPWPNTNGDTEIYDIAEIANIVAKCINDSRVNIIFKDQLGGIWKPFEIKQKLQELPEWWNAPWYYYHVCNDYSLKRLGEDEQLTGQVTWKNNIGYDEHDAEVYLRSRNHNLNGTYL